MLGLFETSTRRVLCVLVLSLCVAALAACDSEKPDKPPTDPVSVCCLTKDGLTDLMTDGACEDANGTQVALKDCEEDLVSLCCMTKDGATSYMTNVECEEVNGTQVALDQCQGDLVSLCCMTKDGVPSYMTNVECEEENGNPVALEFCEEELVSLCCELPDGTTTYMTNVECNDAGGAHVAIAECQEDPPTFCCVIDGTYQYMANPQACSDANGVPSLPHMCGDVCCLVEGQPAGNMTLGACHDLNGSIVADEACEGIEEVCCKTDQGHMWVASDQCDPSQVQPDELCEPEEVCCETPNGLVWVLASDCGAAQILPDDMCEPAEVCCKTDQGNMWVPIDQCDPSQVQPDDACLPEIVCCNTPLSGPMFVLTANCDPANVLPDNQCHADETVCCETPNGPAWMMGSQCYPGTVLPDHACEEPVEDVCCETEQGPMIVPATDCDPAQVLTMDQCESPELVCCETAAGVTWVPANLCDPAQVLPDTMCEYDELVCCKTDLGNQWVLAGDCDPSQIQPDLACEQPVEDVCCETAAGVVWMPADQCPQAQVLPDAMCEEDPPPGLTTCVAFQAIDMAGLPYTLNTGVTLQSYLGTGPYTGVPASNGCSTVPVNGQRGHAGVGSDGPVVFDTPISSFYILQLNVQEGDDLTIAEPNTITQMGCMPGGTAGNAYYRVDLDSPQTTVTVQDVDPGGGSGYSYMIAECTEEAPAVCCDSETGPVVVPVGQCDPALVLPDASCTGEPPPPDDPACVHWTLIDMAALPHTMGSGTTLNAYTGLGPILGDVPTSNGCSTVPADSSRGFAAVDLDGVVDFDAPVSELYVATFHVQTGDDLVTLPTSTITDAGCNLSNAAGGTIQHVSLDTPSAQVSMQDIDPGGGTGYSFMIAECTEWAGK